MSKPFYSVLDLVELLQVSNKTIYRWLETGALAAEKADYGTRISAEALEQFLAAGGITLAEIAEGSSKSPILRNSCGSVPIESIPGSVQDASKPVNSRPKPPG